MLSYAKKVVVGIFRHNAIPVLSLGLGLAGCWWLATRRKVVEVRRVFSSFKDAANAKTGSPNTRASFKALRALLREYGVKALEDELAAGGLVKDGKLTTGTKPFNLFARIGAAEMSQPEMAASNALLGEAGSRFVLCCNRAENDEHWQSSAPEWVGKASMSQRHRFLTVRDLDWRWFNAVLVGIGGGDELRRAITRMEPCAKQPPRGFCLFALQHAPPAPGQAQGGLTPRPASANGQACSGWPAIPALLTTQAWRKC